MKKHGTCYLRAEGRYDFDLSYSFYRRSRFEMVDRFADCFFVRPMLFGEIPVMIQIACKTGLTPVLKVRWQSPVEVKYIPVLRRMLARMFYLDFDIEKFYRHRLDRVMRGLTRRFPGFRPILTPGIFEAAAWAIIGQQVNLQFAYRIKSRLVEYVNHTFHINGQRFFLFPTATEIANIDYDRLRAMQFSERKAQYLVDFARMVAGGELNLEKIAEMDYETAVCKLLSVRGLGPWSANYILLRGAGHRDAFPVGDSGINSAVKTLYKLDGKPDIDFLLKLGERWRPYRSLATFYLWKSL